MGGLVFACIAPHGGLVISEISGAEGRKALATRRAMEELGRRMAAAQPETIVLVTPHGIPVEGAFSLLDTARVGGELSGPGGTIAVSFQVDNALNAAIAATARQCDVPVARLTCGPAARPTACLPLDWGAVVPFWFMGRGFDPPPQVVVACPDRALPLALFPRFGQVVRHAAEQVGRRIAFIASADLGHAHDPCGPYGYDPAAAEYDAATIEAIKAQDLGRMLAWDADWIERAKTDALWQILNLHGAIAGQRFHGELLSYEVPTYFGMVCAAYESGSRAVGQWVLVGTVPVMKRGASPAHCPTARLPVCPTFLREVAMSVPYQWWQRGIVYQVYPRSFLDSNGDGIGDLPGITEKLDYLQWLGVDAIWISPIFPSPMADFGYDVADYTGIEPMFGTLADFDTLLAEAHRRSLKVLLDFVPNHTSDQHPWFQESRSSRDNPKRDWYLWRDPAPNGGPPNNWQSLFRGSAWEYDAATGQYYCHLFLKEQPDLNWRNPAVQRAMLDTLRFWLDRGVDGFRVDVIWLMIKDDQYRDNPINPEYDPTDPHSPPFLPVYTADRPEVHDIIAMMRGVLDEYDERVLIGEIYLPVDRLVTYYGAQGQGVNLPFNFHLILTDWNARLIATLIDHYEAALPPGGWPNWVIGNHDQSRIATRVGAAQARVAAMLLLTLRGTPTIYYGDEIGMHDIPVAPEQSQDPVARTRGEGRDPERTPMQWSAHTNAGFTTGTPWLPIADDYETANVAHEGNDPHSMLTLHHRLIALRHATPALAIGSYRAVQADGDLLAYIREAEGQRYLVVLNLGGQPQHFASEAPINGTIVLATGLDRAAEPVRDALDLRGDEGVVIALD